MSTVKLTADLSGEFVQIIADEVDGMRRDVFPTEIESTFTFALFHVHRAMHGVAADLGGRIDETRLEMAGTRFVVGAA